MASLPEIMPCDLEHGLDPGTVKVRIPKDTLPGDDICFEWDGVFYKCTVPAGVMPGKRFTAFVKSKKAKLQNLNARADEGRGVRSTGTPREDTRQPSNARGGQPNGRGGGQPSSAAMSSTKLPHIGSLMRSSSGRSDARIPALQWDFTRGSDYATLRAAGLRGPLSKPQRVFFADFDWTLSSQHTFRSSVAAGANGLRRLPLAVIERMFGGGRRLQLLKMFFRNLVSVGVATVIVTYGVPELVLIILERAGLTENTVDGSSLLYGIVAVCGVGGEGCFYNKALCINEVCATISGASPRGLQSCFFADDTASHIKTVLGRCGLSKAQVCCPHHGLSQMELKRISDFFHAPTLRL